MTSVEVTWNDHSTSFSVALGEATYSERERGVDGERQVSNCTRHRFTLRINTTVISNYVCIRPITIYRDQYCGFLFTCPVSFSYCWMYGEIGG